METGADFDPLSEEENDPAYAPPLEAETETNEEPTQTHDAAENTDASGSLYSDSDVESDENDEHLSLKRAAEEDLVPSAFKRHKGALNTDYLDLLNRDIGDATQRVCLADEEGQLDPSQMGVTFWSAAEKRLFFEAVARLGQDDLPGIASRIGTKSEIEVNHYLSVLQSARLLRLRDAMRPAIEFPEYPAAVELSQQCCHALDEAADAISVRQERKEEQREESKWGDCWDISPRIARRLDRGESASEGQDLAFPGLFNLHNWLRLSERIFMNSSIPSENWSFIDSSPPSMWATTFEDFHSLALSVTRRLVQTTIFMSISRIRAKREAIPSTRDIVRPQDVEAAIVSLGMKPNSRQFWHKCARRLRLEVYEDPPDRDEEGEQEPLGYEDVERALLGGDEEVLLPATEGPEDSNLSTISEDEMADISDIEALVILSDEEEAAISREADEVLRFSAADFPETHRKKQSLKNRIATERRQEQYAEECDHAASRQAEAEMWDLLQKKPPMELPKVHEPGAVQRSKLDVEGIFPIGRDWRTRTRYRSEWENE
ncbi:hypothetical protein ACJ41O_008069 [Fusarium nematophilum]